MKIQLIGSLCFLCAGCGVYRTSFDCPPGKGIGCAPVNDVLEMIVEREEGEDLFVTDLGTALLLKQEENRVLPNPCCVKHKKPTLYLVKETSGQLILSQGDE